MHLKPPPGNSKLIHDLRGGEVKILTSSVAPCRISSTDNTGPWRELRGAIGAVYIKGAGSSPEKDIGAMNTLARDQRGASAVGTVILLAAVAYGIYVGFQYLPQLIESRSVDSILTSIESAHRAEPVRDAQAIRSMIDNHLHINHLDHLRDKFDVREFGNEYIIEVNYERNLDLLYTEKVLAYETSLTLR
jgi:hypothetical protein